MFNSIRSLFTRRLQANFLELPLAGLMLISGVSTGHANPAPNRLNPAAATPAQTQVAQASAANQLPDGVYLYGQSSQPDQMGKEYMVFEVRRGRTIGAVYMPYSEFNCFHGTAAAQKLDLIVSNPFAETADSSPPEKRPTTEFAAVGDTPRVWDGPDPISFPVSINLQSYQRIANVSENDQRILGTCKANYQDQVWGR
jgi:hypothetical protein